MRVGSIEGFETRLEREPARYRVIFINFRFLLAEFFLSTDSVGYMISLSRSSASTKLSTWNRRD